MITQPAQIFAGNGTRRACALVRKELRQMCRDKSTLTLGIFLPLALLFIFGFGLSLDVRLVPVAVVRDTPSPAIFDLFTSLQRSPYFSPSMTDSWAEAEKLLRQGKTDAIVRMELKEGLAGREQVQVIVNGRDSNKARITQRYLEGALAGWSLLRSTPTGFLPAGVAEQPAPGQAGVELRIWYNEAQESRFFPMPGVTALVMTLIGALLTALVIAREWERGTYEALISTPAKKIEIMAGKTLPYFALGMAGLFLCLAASAWVFEIPMRGALLLIILGSALYLLVALGFGLFISATVKKQFLASQLVLVFSFMPTLMLSGFIFDLKSAPPAAYYIAHIFPATWYVDLLQTLFLVGNIQELILRNFLIISCFAVCMLCLTGRKMRKSLE
jgi:ABC-2 type transport system permease protein